MTLLLVCLDVWRITLGNMCLLLHKTGLRGVSNSQAHAHAQSMTISMPPCCSMYPWMDDKTASPFSRGSSELVIDNLVLFDQHF